MAKAWTCTIPNLYCRFGNQTRPQVADKWASPGGSLGTRGKKEAFRFHPQVPLPCAGRYLKQV